MLDLTDRISVVIGTALCEGTDYNEGLETIDREVDEVVIIIARLCETIRNG